MISLLKNHTDSAEQDHVFFEEQTTQAEEAHLINLIYRFAGKKDEWFNLLLSLSNCISIYESLPEGHPYQGVSERLLSHLKNAIKISGRLSIGAHTLLSSNSLDQLPVPAGIMDKNGRVIEINHLALNIINRLPQWSIKNQHLSLAHTDLNKHICTLINAKESFSALPLYYENALDNIEFELDDHSLNSRSSFYLTKIPNEDDATQPYFYFCFNEKKSSFINIETLKADYQLTETEALVVLTLSEEITSTKTAKKLKLKETTIRGHLTNIYSKMGVSRKPELIRKIMLKCLSQATQNNQFFTKQSTETANSPPLSLVQNTKSKRHTLKQLRLSDERNLSYLDIDYSHQSECTDVIVILHNMMGSAFELPPSAYSYLQRKHVRIIIPERPGYGDSTPHQQRSHESFCQDIRQLLDHLNIDKVKLIAHSIGGAYALAMAEFLPERVERIAMVNAITRLEDMLKSKPVPVLISAVHQSLRFAPFLIEPILKMAVGKDIEHFYSQQLNYMRPTKEGRSADINLLNQPEFRHYSLKNLKQSAKQGIQIWSDELKLSFSEWSFEVRNTKMDYQFWHGEEDDVISVHAAIRLAKELNTSRFFRLKYETHYLFPRHITEVIETLISPEQVSSSNAFQTVMIN